MEFDIKLLVYGRKSWSVNVPRSISQPKTEGHYHRKYLAWLYKKQCINDVLHPGTVRYYAPTKYLPDYKGNYCWRRYTTSYSMEKSGYPWVRGYPSKGPMWDMFYDDLDKKIRISIEEKSLQYKYINDRDRLLIRLIAVLKILEMTFYENATILQNITKHTEVQRYDIKISQFLDFLSVRNLQYIINRKKRLNASKNKKHKRSKKFNRSCD